MNDPKRLPSIKSAAAVRRRCISRHGSYHTAKNREPNKWHTNPDCGAGQQINVQNLRCGHGDKQSLCDLC